MTKKYTSILLTLLFAPVLAFAAPPADVTGLQAEVSADGEIIVTWDKLDEDIAYYNVYYSSQSILGNNGEYEDYERTSGPKGAYTFPGNPTFGGTLYISVLAVNQNGEESAVFAEEISVQVGISELGGDLGFPEFDELDELEDLDELFDDLEDWEDEIVVAENPPQVVGTSSETEDVAITPPLAPSFIPPAIPLPTPVPNPAPQPIVEPVVEETQVVEEVPEVAPLMEEPILSVTTPTLPTPTEIGPETFIVGGQQADEVAQGPTQNQEALARLNQATNTGLDEERFGGRLHFLAAESLSPTKIRLDFSHEILIEAADAPKAFSIVKSNGDKLQLRRLVIDGMDVTLETKEQERGVVYEVRLSEPLKGDPDLPLDTESRTAFFTGHADGRDPEPQKPKIAHDAESVLQPQDITGFTVNHRQMANGLYRVSANWNVEDVSGGLAFYIVRQSLDGGRTFSQPQLIPAGVNGVDIQGVQPGQFGLGVQTLNQQQYASRGVFENLNLGGTSVVQQPFVGSVAQPPVQQPQFVQPPVQQPSIVPPAGPRRDALPEAGAVPVVGMASLIGAIVGWRRARKM